MTIRIVSTRFPILLHALVALGTILTILPPTTRRRRRWRWRYPCCRRCEWRRKPSPQAESVANLRDRAERAGRTSISAQDTWLRRQVRGVGGRGIGGDAGTPAGPSSGWADHSGRAGGARRAWAIVADGAGNLGGEALGCKAESATG